MTSVTAMVLAWAIMSGYDGNLTDLECLATNAWFEAGSYHDARSITQVVRNRVASKYYENSPCAVIWEPVQFSWTGDKRSDQPNVESGWAGRKWIRMVTVVAWAWDAPDRTSGATHYHARYVQPEWANRYCVVYETKHHIYYRECS